MDVPTLTGSRVILEPLSLAHVDALCETGLDPEIWRYTTSRVRNRDDMVLYVETALQWQREGTAVPFATIDRASKRVVGSSRFANIAPEHKRAEIGWTWIARDFQRTHVNTEAKYLMLRLAFEQWKYHRVTPDHRRPSRRFRRPARDCRVKSAPSPGRAECGA